MKTSKDPRHLERIHTMQALFAWDFKNGRLKGSEELETDSEELTQVKEPSPSGPEKSGKTQDIILNLEEIDHLIEEAAPTWPIKKINKIDLAILRQAVYELVTKPVAPPKVIVDEAVELAKEYGSDSSASFINGALGKLISDQNIETT